jgi:hypothetical protein
MSKKALVPVNVLAKASAPSGQYAGDVYYDSTDVSMFVYTGSVWTPVSGTNLDGGTPTSNYTSNPVVNGGTP